jgi:hypothetical protein
MFLRTFRHSKIYLLQIMRFSSCLGYLSHSHLLGNTVSEKYTLGLILGTLATLCLLPFYMKQIKELINSGVKYLKCEARVNVKLHPSLSLMREGGDSSPQNGRNM